MRNLMITLMTVVAVALLAGPAQAALLVDEDFQTPMLDNKTPSPGFAGWSYVNGDNVPAVSTETGLPGDEDFATNQAIQLEWTSGVAKYALSHAWSTDDVFTLSVNASPQAWHIHEERWIRPKIRQNDEDDTVLWDPGETAETKLFQAAEGEYAWNGPGPYGESTWQAEEDGTLYTFTINASDFTAGSPGETIYLELASSGSRGMFYDNVEFSSGVIPEPASLMLLGLGGLGFMLRRRGRK